MLSLILLIVFGFPAILAWKNFDRHETGSHLFVALLLTVLAIFFGFAALVKLFAGTMILAVVVCGLALIGSLTAYALQRG